MTRCFLAAWNSAGTRSGFGAVECGLLNFAAAARDLIVEHPQDYVQVPPPQAYFEPINWHRTALHELGHNAAIRIMPHLLDRARLAV